MSGFRPSLVLALLILCGGAVTPAAAQQNAVADAKTVLTKSIAAFNARDYDVYGTYLADDLEAYTGVYSPLRIVGKQGWMQFIRGLDGFASASYEQRQSECRAYNNDVVLCNGYFVFSTTTKAGATEVQSGRESSTLVRVGGRWLIANFHFSPLF